MKIRDIVNIISKDGWFEVRQKGSHKQYKHSVKKAW
jgi:predicted RNA binding protein YcfA (HicA-like mRNA interferase family)